MDNTLLEEDVSSSRLNYLDVRFEEFKDESLTCMRRERDS